MAIIATARSYYNGNGLSNMTQLTVHPPLGTTVARLTLVCVLDNSFSRAADVQKLMTVLSSSALEIKVAFVLTNGDRPVVLDDGVFQLASDIKTSHCFKAVGSYVPECACHSTALYTAFGLLEREANDDDASASAIFILSHFSASGYSKDSKENLASHVDALSGRHPAAVFAIALGQTSSIDYSLIDTMVNRRGCYILTSRSSIESDVAAVLERLSTSTGCCRATVAVSSNPEPEPDEEDALTDNTNTPTQKRKRVRRESATKKKYYQIDLGLITPTVSFLGRSFLVDAESDKRIEMTFSSSSGKHVALPMCDGDEDLGMWWHNFSIHVRSRCNIGLDVFTCVANELHDNISAVAKTAQTRKKIYVLKRVIDLMVTRSAVHTRRDLIDYARKDQSKRRNVYEESVAMRDARLGFSPYPPNELPALSLPGYGFRSERFDDTNKVLSIRNALTCMSLVF